MSDSGQIGIIFPDPYPKWKAEQYFFLEISIYSPL